MLVDAEVAPSSYSNSQKFVIADQLTDLLLRPVPKLSLNYKSHSIWKITPLFPEVINVSFHLHFTFLDPFVPNTLAWLSVLIY